ncbi:MAG: flagellar hook-basal body complex protein [Phycisphaerae bacterium]|nr:flagellar hook-basal body complex protein [Phycisphaerae bacterium]
MGSALSAAVTGLKAHQNMLDVAGNNLANVNTVGYKSSSITFAELLSQTVKKASGPSGTLGGMNPQQLGNGVGIASIVRNMTQGNIFATGQDLDVAIDGSGYFVLSDGQQDVYTRIGSFAVDASNTLVDPANGYKVQRIGAYGEAEGFQTAGDSSIHIPWDAAMPARATTSVTLNGNLRSTASASDATAQKITGNLALTTGGGASVASASTYVSDLDQWGTALGVGATGTLRISGVKEDGTTFTNQDVTWVGADAGAGPTMQDILNGISGLFDSSTATLDSNGKMVLTSEAGYSLANITSMSYMAAGSDSLSVPTYFTLDNVGGNDSKTFNVTVYDSYGAEHVLTGTFVKTDAANTWDLVIPSISGETTPAWGAYDINSGAFNRRISGITFNSNGSYNGLASASETLTLGVQFANNPGVTQTITVDLGTPGAFAGVTQFQTQQSSAAALTQDGYKAGALSSVSIDEAGMVIGSFTNGEKVNIAALQIGIFQNAGGLEAAGDGYYLPTANSGTAVAGMAASGGAGTITGKSLEGSNVEVATEFVNMMQAQNGFQANARTIKVATDILRELTNLIR